MDNGIARSVSILLLATLIMSAFVISVPAGGKEEEIPTRAASGFIAKDDFYMHTAYNAYNMWVVVWMENSDTYYQKLAGSDYYFNFREVANAFAFPVDGSSHSSGDQRRALVELFTATDCGFCPGSEGALDRLADQRLPDDFALIEWHRALSSGNDPYETGSSQGRFGSYNVSATPCVIFDGITAQSGGDQNPSNTKLFNDYGNKIDNANMEKPFVSFSGSSDIGGTYLSFNVTFDVINTMPKGNWMIRAAVCEDLQKDHSGATLRHTPRGTVESKMLTDLQTGYPDISIDEEATFEGLDRTEIKENLTIYWDASDAEDGTDLSIDLLYRTVGGDWKTVATDLANTGSYIWNTADPRVPDALYQVRLQATDSDLNSILSGKWVQFTIDNYDAPTGNFTFPMAGDSLVGRPSLRWNADDDEDNPGLLLTRISIRNSSEVDWKIITYNQVNGEDWIVNQGSYDFNTLNYEDLNTYTLKLDLLDTDGMMTTFYSYMFEIYNNDRPIAYILGPPPDSTITGTLDIGWKVMDQEDVPSGMSGNFSFKRADQIVWTVLWEGMLDDEMLNRAFPTSELDGDGDYTIMFTVTDSRGLSHSASRDISVYDPDLPVFDSVSGPADLTDIRSDTISISWVCSDPDEGEEISFSVLISPYGEENWTTFAKDLDTINFIVDLTLLDEGSYELKVVAKDAITGLTSEMGFGPFNYNAPDPPELEALSHPDGLTGSFPVDVNDTLEDGNFFIDLNWDASDPDGDNISYSIYFMKITDDDWTLLAVDLTMGYIEWNLTGLTSGDYKIRIVAVDNSNKELSSELELGPFTWFNVFTDIVDDKDDDTGPDDTDDTDDEPDWVLFIIIGSISIVVVVILVLIVLLVVSKTTKKTADIDVIPAQKDMDYHSIPDFERTAPVAPMVQQPVVSGPIPGAVQMSPEAVSWESDETSVPEPPQEIPAEEPVVEQPQESPAEEPFQEQPTEAPPVESVPEQNIGAPLAPPS